MGPKISAIIHAKNEEDALPGLLRNLQGAFDEILLLDGRSTDKTREIAKRMGARVIIRRREHLLHISEESNNYYMKLARNNWIFGIDCDELITPELKRALPRLVADPRYKAYRFPRRNYVSPEVWCRRCFYPNYQLRLFDRRFITFPKEVHTDPIVDGQVKNTVYPMLHLTYTRSKARVESQHQEYQKAESEVLQNPLMFAISYVFVFVYFFFFKLGILEPPCWAYVLVRVDYYARHTHHMKSWISRLAGKMQGKNQDWNP